MKTAYKLRFLPLILTLLALLAVFMLKYYFHLQTGKSLGYAIAFAVAGFIYMRLMQDIAKTRKEKAEHPEPVKTEREVREEAVRDEKDILTNRNIPFSLVRLVFAILVFLSGIPVIMNGNIVFGIVLSALGLFVGLLSAFWTAQYFRRLKALKSAAAQPSYVMVPVFPDDEDVATIRICDDGTSLLVFERRFSFAGRLTEETLTTDMAAAIGAEVDLFLDHAGVFIIMSNDGEVIRSAIAYMNANR
ncbi:MAG: hypothetical protein LBT26_09725 [Clostridiales Family XIII bacterium]|jgi:hypothetical protein|nr:hypothetical protein [Clostridiales Family XIII bacterium]